MTLASAAGVEPAVVGFGDRDSPAASHLWRPRRDSNSRPSGSKPDTLSAELRRPDFLDYIGVHAGLAVCTAVVRVS